ncbi:MAG: T9SS type A sorting domain-containing protein [Brumimicrobium sp.]|nr:T9SS type A sorting domain-containing protein [Brumimicrobium sp.]
MSDVRDLIRDGAEKVNPDTYDYNMFGNTPGYNNEMFYGRVSCINSINQTTNIKEEDKAIELTVMNMGEYQYLVFISKSGQIQPYELYDISGRLLLSGTVTPGNVEIPIDLSLYHRGIYILKIYNSERTILSTKLMK